MLSAWPLRVRAFQHGIQFPVQLHSLRIDFSNARAGFPSGGAGCRCGRIAESSLRMRDVRLVMSHSLRITAIFAFAFTDSFCPAKPFWRELSSAAASTAANFPLNCSL